ncbi:glycosyltransferase family 2 protein [Enterovibrio baiacu]|uniref:glycosyltransferase family 2 protein n=1 Tax=Enterovibrio baiacu TaxID=2491023 RepID=UPI003D12515B
MDTVIFGDLMTLPTISIVCPCHNEQEVLHAFTDKIVGILSESIFTYELLFVNDGSTDDTLAVLRALAANSSNIRIINLSRNFGKEAALTAGLDLAQGEVIIPIDADLQDPPELIHDFLLEWQKGYDVVVAKRIDRSSDTLAKKITANLFYRFHNTIADVEIPDNVGDFRLITRRVVMAIQLLPENQRFMKGIFSWVGFKTSVVEYSRQPRAAGESSFNGWRLWNFALEGITSFSTAPPKSVALSCFFCVRRIVSFWRIHHIKNHAFWCRYTGLRIAADHRSIFWWYSINRIRSHGGIHRKALHGIKATACLHH